MHRTKTMRMLIMHTYCILCLLGFVQKNIESKSLKLYMLFIKKKWKGNHCVRWSHDLAATKLKHLSRAHVYHRHLFFFLIYSCLSSSSSSSIRGRYYLKMSNTYQRQSMLCIISRALWVNSRTAVSVGARDTECHFPTSVFGLNVKNTLLDLYINK